MGLLRSVDSRHSEYFPIPGWESGKDFFEMLAGLVRFPAAPLVHNIKSIGKDCRAE
jgi:hypothetical protein